MCTFRWVVVCAGWPSEAHFTLRYCIVQTATLVKCRVCVEGVALPPVLGLSGSNLQLPLYCPP